MSQTLQTLQARQAQVRRHREVPPLNLAGGPAQVRIALVAPDLLSRSGIEGMLGGHPSLRLVPDSRVADAHLLVLVAPAPGPEIAEAVRIASGHRRLPVLAVLDGPGPDGGAGLADLGVVACLWRSGITPERLAEEIRAVATTRRTARLADDLEEYRRRQGPDQAPSRREADVLRLLAEGLGIPEIAQRLAYSERTVQKTLYAVTSRLDLRNRTHAVAYAWREGVL